jgi:hypothetical protein
MIRLVPFVKGQFVVEEAGRAHFLSMGSEGLSQVLSRVCRKLGTRIVAKMSQTLSQTCRKDQLSSRDPSEYLVSLIAASKEFTVFNGKVLETTEL